MKQIKILIIILSIISTGHIYSQIQSLSGELEKNFVNPPQSAKPWVYWINMDGHFTKEGITADLESMKAVGIGGMIHMDVDVGVPRGMVPFMSETWQANFKHAVLECERLGLEFTTITGPGWTGTGGPWVKANESMQHLLPVSMNTKGPAMFNEVLPKPQPRVSEYHSNQTQEMREALTAFYEDVAVYAFPKCDPEVENIDEKALFVRNPYTSMPGVRTHFPSPASFPETDKSQVIDPAKIIDLTSACSRTGVCNGRFHPASGLFCAWAGDRPGPIPAPLPQPGLDSRATSLIKRPWNPISRPTLIRFSRALVRGRWIARRDLTVWMQIAGRWAPRTGRPDSARSSRCGVATIQGPGSPPIRGAWWAAGK